jgi:hypothetical protein
MLTSDKKITTAEYWNNVYAGANNNATVDASNTKRPANVFDRFSWVAQYAEGPNVLGVASGHAHVEKRIKAAHPLWSVIASDQAPEAKQVAKYAPYWMVDAYDIPECIGHPYLRSTQTLNKLWNTLIITQALEYMDDQQRFLTEAKRVAAKLLLTLPLGEMEKWSQLRIYTEENVKELLQPFGIIEVFEKQGDLLLVKLKFHE